MPDLIWRGGEGEAASEKNLWSSLPYHNDNQVLAEWSIHHPTLGVRICDAFKDSKTGKQKMFFSFYFILEFLNFKNLPPN